MEPPSPAQEPCTEPPADDSGAAQHDVLALAQRLCASAQAFAIVTVVRAVAPTSASAGAQAIVCADGTLHGWIGGGCTRQVVIDAALQAISQGAPRLVRIANDDEVFFEDVQSHRMACASNGEVELFIHPHLPTPLLMVLGDTPLAASARAFAQQVGFRVSTQAQAGSPQLALVATQGDGDEAALQSALASSAQRVLLIASRRKAQRLHEALREQGVSEERLAQLEAPAGPDIGAHTPAQIALAAVAGALAWWNRHAGIAQPLAKPPPREEVPLAPSTASAAPRVLDPVCGMRLDPQTVRHSLEWEGVRYFFCCEGCRAAFARDPRRYGAAASGLRENAVTAGS